MSTYRYHRHRKITVPPPSMRKQSSQGPIAQPKLRRRFIKNVWLVFFPFGISWWGRIWGMIPGRVRSTPERPHASPRSPIITNINHSGRTTVGRSFHSAFVAPLKADRITACESILCLFAQSAGLTWILAPRQIYPSNRHSWNNRTSLFVMQMVRFVEVSREKRSCSATSQQLPKLDSVATPAISLTAEVFHDLNTIHLQQTPLPVQQWHDNGVVSKKHN
ncbi:hypothetical protein V8F06_003131 [Rhypophila decipiens]